MKGKEKVGKGVTMGLLKKYRRQVGESINRSRRSNKKRGRKPSESRPKPSHQTRID